MRVAVVVAYFPSVSQTFVLNQITGLLDRGHEVDIFAVAPEPGEGSSAEHPEVGAYRLLERVHYEPVRPRGRMLRALRTIPVLARHYGRCPRIALHALRSVRGGSAGNGSAVQLLWQGIPFLGRPAYDVILCHFGTSGERALALRDAGILRGPIVTAFHGADVSRYVAQQGRAVYADLFARGDLFLPVSDFWRRRLIALGCPPEKTIVHRMGVELRRFAFTPRHLRERGGCGTVRILTVARLVEKKGVEYAVRAIAALRDRGVTNVEYRILGDGPLRPRLARLIRELGVGDMVQLLGDGDQARVARAMRRAHLFVAPSVTAADGDMEGIPVSLMEAMACGLPVVSTYHSGIPELVVDGVTGFLTPERDVDALALALQHLVEHPARWPAMGAAARAVVERQHSIEVLNDRLVELLERGPAEWGERPRPRVRTGGQREAARARHAGASRPATGPHPSIVRHRLSGQSGDPV